MGRNVPRGTEGCGEDILLEGARQLDLSLSSRQVSSLLVYLEELGRWNTRFNLTGIRDVRGMIIRHLLDSLAALAILPFLGASCPAHRILDAGSGAGFPGLPIRICRPQVRLTLVESRKKKAAFLHTICGRLVLKEVEVLSERLEAVAREPSYGQVYDLMIARGIRPSALLGPASALLSKGGRIVIWASGHSEIGGFPEIGDFSGWVCGQICPYRLPFEDRPRRLIVMVRAAGRG